MTLYKQKHYSTTENARLSQKKSRYERKIEGKCIRCGRHNDNKPYLQCVACIRYKRDYRNENRERLLLSSKETHWNIRLTAFRLISKQDVPTCVVCGTTDPRILTTNHINGDGSKEQYRCYAFFKQIVNGERKTDDLEVRCFSCNIIYEYFLGHRYCPPHYRVDDLIDDRE